MGSAGDAAMGEATAAELPVPGAAVLRPARPGEGETILWEGRPASGLWRLFEMLGFVLLIGLLAWLALLLIAPHLRGSAFAGQPDRGALPLVLGMVAGTVFIIALPVWLRASARGRCHYMLTSRRALVWLGGRIVGEALLFGSEMRVADGTVSFASGGVWLDWRLRDQGPDLVRFERIADPGTVAALAEAHGARRRP